MAAKLTVDKHNFLLDNSVGAGPVVNLSNSERILEHLLAVALSSISQRAKRLTRRGVGPGGGALTS